MVQRVTGTVVDTVTNLMWKQCQEGVSGATCNTGGSIFPSWDTANTNARNSRLGGYNDWRLPTLLELQSTLASSCVSAPPLPWINGTAFPNTPSATVFWSATPNASSSTDAWLLWFKDGSSQSFARSIGFYVRFVRAGQAFGLLSPSAQTLSFNAPPTLPIGGTAVVVATSALPNSGNPVVYASTTPAVCAVNPDSGVVSTVVGAQASFICTISANQFGRATNGQNFAQAAQVTQNIVIAKAAQTLSFASSPAVSVGGTGVVAATSNQNLTPVTFASATPSACSVSGTNGSTVTGLTVGTCTIAAAQAGDTTYLAATANQSFTIGPAYLVCNLHMDGANPMLATKEGLVLLRAMIGFTGTAVTAGTGIVTPWATIREELNTKCGTAFQ